MRNDIKSNYKLAVAIAAASHGVGAVNSASADHRDGSSVSFLVNAGTFGGSATLDVKTQYSEDNSTFVDYPAADQAGNDEAILQMIAVGSAELHVPNPRGRYSRVVATVAVAAVVYGVSSVLGPLRHVSA